MKIYTSPENTAGCLSHTRRTFLAGSIEMGAAGDWQSKMIEVISDMSRTFIHSSCIFNPRRVDWNPAWEQKIENGPFFQQVTWELDSLDRSTHILFYFEPGTKSPISLLELGRYSKSDKKVLVICPEGFWRKGNVDIICYRDNIPLLSTASIDAKNYTLQRFLT